MIIEDKVLRRYYKKIDSFELLSAEREIELAETIRKYKSGKQKQEAREELMNHNLRLVVTFAFEFYNKENSFIYGKGKSELTIMDMINAGNVGLMRAVDLYNPKKFKTRFSTYAVAWIKEGMLSLVYSYNSVVHVPAHIVSGSSKYRKIKEEDKDETLSDKEIMKSLKVTKEVLKNIKNSKVTSFSGDSVAKDNDDDGVTTYRDFIPDSKQESPFEMTANKDNMEVILKALKVLDPVSRDIIKEQFLNPKKMRLQDLGKRHNISGERVRQIKYKALKKMRWQLKGKSTLHM